MNKVNAIIKEKDTTIESLNQLLENKNIEIKKLKLSSTSNKNADELNKFRARIAA